MAQTATTNSTGNSGVRQAQKDILFKPEQLISLEVYVDVKDKPVVVMGNILADHRVQVFHVYQGTSADCLDIPEIPAYADNGCTLLELSNTEDVACANSRKLVNQIWLYDKGRYRLQYVHPTFGATEIPNDVYIWTQEGNSSCCSGISHNGYRT